MVLRGSGLPKLPLAPHRGLVIGPSPVEGEALVGLPLRELSGLGPDGQAVWFGWSGLVTAQTSTGRVRRLISEKDGLLTSLNWPRESRFATMQRVRPGLLSPTLMLCEADAHGDLRVVRRFDDEQDWQSRVSPGGRYLARYYRLAGGDPHTGVLDVIDLGGASAGRVRRVAEGRMSQPTWDPRGTRVAYGLQRPAGGLLADVHVWDAATGADTVVALSTPLGARWSVAWEPDGDRLLVVSTRAWAEGQSEPAPGYVARICRLDGRVVREWGAAGALVAGRWAGGAGLLLATGGSRPRGPGFRLEDAASGREVLSVADAEPEGAFVAQTGPEWALVYRGPNMRVIWRTFTP